MRSALNWIDDLSNRAVQFRSCGRSAIDLALATRDPGWGRGSVRVAVGDPMIRGVTGMAKRRLALLTLLAVIAVVTVAVFSGVWSAPRDLPRTNAPITDPIPADPTVSG